MVLQSMKWTPSTVLVLRLPALSQKLAPAQLLQKRNFFFLSFMKPRIRDCGGESSQVTTTPNKWAAIEYLPKCPKQNFGVDGGVRFAYHHSTWYTVQNVGHMYRVVPPSAAIPSRG